MSQVTSDMSQVTSDVSQVLKSRLRCGYEELLDTSALVGTFVADNRSLQTSFLQPSRPSWAVQTMVSRTPTTLAVNAWPQLVRSDEKADQMPDDALVASTMRHMMVNEKLDHMRSAQPSSASGIVQLSRAVAEVLGINAWRMQEPVSRLLAAVVLEADDEVRHKLVSTEPFLCGQDLSALAGRLVLVQGCSPSCQVPG